MTLISKAFLWSSPQYTWLCFRSRQVNQNKNYQYYLSVTIITLHNWSCSSVIVILHKGHLSLSPSFKWWISNDTHRHSGQVFQATPQVQLYLFLSLSCKCFSRGIPTDRIHPDGEGEHPAGDLRESETPPVHKAEMWFSQRKTSTVPKRYKGSLHINQDSVWLWWTSAEQRGRGRESGCKRLVVSPQINVVPWSSFMFFQRKYIQIV